jgi:hypothetical protein
MIKQGGGMDPALEEGIMDTDMAQLADILVDWCDMDLEGDSFAGASSTVVAQTMVKCLAFTLSHDQNAREALARIVRKEMAEIQRRYKEYDR